jgi:hypothetical protein
MVPRVAIPLYTRVRLFWGALDITVNVPGYGTANSTSLGASAVEGSGIGVRRAQIVIARTAPTGFAEDVATMHFDFVNYTGGSPDDTWTTGDFTTLEGFLATWWTAVKVDVAPGNTFREVRWYRVGAGITPPNPAVRVQPFNVASTGASSALPPQVAISITNRTGSRKHWGRTYMPGAQIVATASDGRIASNKVDALALAVSNLYTSAAGADFNPVVYCPSTGSALAVESVSVDNIFDVIRSRRWQSTTYRKTYP